MEMRRQPGEIRQWEFLKMHVVGDEDAEASAEWMGADGWEVITLRLNPIVFKRADGKTLVAWPEPPVEPDPEARVGDHIYV